MSDAQITPVLRDYQARAVRRVREEWATHRAVCLVAPTGSGKTVMGSALCSDVPRVVWVAHRGELVQQATTALRRLGLWVGGHAPGLAPDPNAPVQVGTIQTLLARGARPPADLVVLDECHHYAPGSPKWSALLDAYPDARLLGLTATPERGDGSPLGDVFGSLVEAASYSELIEAGHIVQCEVFRRPDDAARGGWALDPITAYRKHGADRRAFAFFARVAHADEWAASFTAAGIPAVAITDATSGADRAVALERFARGDEGDPRVICNVYTMTEGVDVPAAAVCLLARCPQHPSTFLQMVGRVLRPAPGKTSATLIDLEDATIQHGYPTQDRRYSLDGKGIVADVDGPAGVRTCRQCGCCWESARGRACPSCGYEPPLPPPPKVTIWGHDLRRVYAGADTPDDAKQSEWGRLVALCRTRGWGLSWALKEYAKLFGAESRPPASPEERRDCFADWRTFGAQKGFKPGFAAARYKDAFGGWPPREWTR